MTSRAVALLSLLLCAGPAASFAATSEPIPDWAAAAVRDTSSLSRSGDAVVLLRQRLIAIQPDGRITTSGREVVRVMRAPGRNAARCLVPYVMGQGDLRELHGWLVTGHGSGRVIPLRDHADFSASAEDLQNEVRIAALSVPDEIELGAVLIAEWTLDDRPPYLQMEIPLADKWPVARSRVELRVPPDWRTTARLIPGDSLAPQQRDGVLAWDFAQPSGGEPGASAAPDLRLALSFIPAHPSRQRSFSDWSEVSAWICELARATDADPMIAQEAQRIAQAQATPLARLREAAQVAQQVRYASIQLGLGRGGGYRPRPAAQVLRERYGDCKDHANLFCALARSLGMRAWLVPVYSGDRDYVEPAWPTPQQFNHCIAAVEVDESVTLPAVAHHHRLGAVLFFDPTDPDTPLGELPELEQSSWGLLADGADGELVKLPDAGPEGNVRSWEARGELSESGALRAHVVSENRGLLARQVLGQRRQLGTSGFLSTMEASLSRMRPESNFENVSASLDPMAPRIEWDWTSQAQARKSSDGALIFGLGTWVDHVAIDPPSEEEGEALQLTGRIDRERYRIRLPAGFSFRDAPADTAIDAAPWRFERRSRLEGDTLVVDQSWACRRTSVPAGRIEALHIDQRKVHLAERSIWRLEQARR